MDKRVPEVRFKGFVDDWEQRKLNEIITYTKGFAFKSNNYKKNGIRIIRVSDLSSDDIKPSSNNIYIKKNYDESLNKYKIHRGEIIVTTVGSKATMHDSAVGRPIYVKDKNDQFLNQNLVKINSIDGFNNFFIYCQLSQKRYMDFIATIERGNANQANVAIKDLFEFSISSSNTKEQSRIAKLLMSVTNAITLYQHQLDQLEKLKKGLLQKLFPQDGQKAPYVRFADFHGDWELRKLEQLSDLQDGDRGKNYPSEYDFSQMGHTIFLNAKNVTKYGFSFKSNQYISLEKSELLGGGKLITNDIVLTTRGSIGNTALYDTDISNRFPSARINSGMLIIRVNSNISSEFIVQFLISYRGQIKLKKVSFGSAQPQLTKKDMLQYNTPITNHKEQTKIGLLLKKIDQTIILYQNKINDYKSMKKYCLQKLFI